MLTDVVRDRVVNIILFTYFVPVKLGTWPGYSCRLLGLDKYVHHHPLRGKIEIKINWKTKIQNLVLPGYFAVMVFV